MASSRKAKEKTLYLHKCETLKTEFYTSREVCGFCLISINADNQLVKVNKIPESEKKGDTSDEKKVVLEKPNFIIVKDAAPVENLKIDEEITVVTTNKSATHRIEEDTPIVESEIRSTKENQNTQKKSATAFIGCLAVLGIFIILVIICSISKRSNESNNSQSLTQIENTNNTTANKTNSSNLSRSSTFQVKPFFRDNSSIILDGAELREEPEYNSYIVNSVERGTKIRVINQKSSKSPWFK